MSYIKNYNKWNTRKQALNEKDANQLFHEREVWWCALGVNIGSEQDGKNDDFERPVLIFRKINADRLLILPISTKIKNESDRLTTSIAGQDSQILISQIRMISSKRLLRRNGWLKISTYNQVLIATIKLLIGRN